MASRTLSLLLGLLVAFPVSARSATIRVPADHPTIQAGIDAAAVGDTVLVAPATYVGPGNKNLDFRLKDIVLRSELGPKDTIIDCEGVGRGFFLAGGLTSAAVISGITVMNGHSGAGNEGGGGMIVLGCSPTIVDCNFVDNFARSTSNSGGGGGIAFNSSASSVSRCSFMRNEAQGDLLPIAGAISAQGSQLAVSDCDFSDNAVIGTAGVGGALCGVFLSTITVSGCEFAGNQAPSYGGAISMSTGGLIEECTFRNNRGGGGGGISASGVTIQDCVFEDNVATSFGGAMAPSACDVRRCVFSRNTAVRGGALYLTNLPVISKCVFIANSADRGGAIYALHSGRLTGCTIAFNTAPLGGALWAGPPVFFEQTIIAFNGPGQAIECESGTPELSCSNVYGNIGGDWVGCISSQAGTKGNLAIDPLFCDQLEENLHLCENSPCAPGQTGACGLIGALDVDCPACGTTAVEPTTWGNIKARFGSFR